MVCWKIPLKHFYTVTAFHRTSKQEEIKQIETGSKCMQIHSFLHHSVAFWLFRRALSFHAWISMDLDSTHDKCRCPLIMPCQLTWTPLWWCFPLTFSVCVLAWWVYTKLYPFQAQRSFVGFHLNVRHEIMFTTHLAGCTPICIHTYI